MNSSSQKVLLVILDGWGHGIKKEADALQQANTPFVDKLYSSYPNSELVTFGTDVGLPEGQMGNSEVGHMNIGAGRVVYQELARINKAVKENTLKDNPTIQAALSYAMDNDKAVHLMGLVSDGGVHSHINHLKHLCELTENTGLKRVYIHAFMDGRDTAPDGGKEYLKDLLLHIADKNVELASVIGRYYAMDRDNRWERIKLAYDVLVHAKGEPTMDVLSTINERYNAGETDEFLKPIVCTTSGKPTATIQEGDVVLCFNFRTDRPREITSVLTQQAYPEYEMTPLNLHYVTMTRYDESFQGIQVIFTKDDLKNTLGEVLSNAGKTQVRIAETEKYPHVTFFFSGGQEEAFKGEERLLVASPKVATYDLQPEMSANEITTAICKHIDEHQPDFICLNYANTDMVGHTGDFQAAMKAAETVDVCVKTLIEKALAFDYDSIIIADHGNSDFMINEDGSPHTAHTTNLVPFIYVGKNATATKVKDGKLADIAPTILKLMDIEAPEEMTGNVLIEK